MGKVRVRKWGIPLAPVNAWRLPSWQAFESLKLEIVNGVE
jgi:hypothetical protein